MSTMCQGFSHFCSFLHHFVLAKLATSSIEIKNYLVSTLSLQKACHQDNKTYMFIHKKDIFVQHGHDAWRADKYTKRFKFKKGK